MNTPENLKYTNEHEWVRLEDDGILVVGITDFAQSELGELVYVEVDTVGDEVAKDEVFGTVEAVKTTSDLFMPVSGEVLEFNSAIDESEGDDPGLLNSDPYGEGWIVKIKISDESELEGLLSAEEYANMIA
ncbi:MAG: glycine cleavage system protein GcvH [Saprospiraceae bacterium]|nr:glycine cleavage system protein GcvH [Saprospiraceae bacterium]